MKRCMERYVCMYAGNLQEILMRLTQRLNVKAIYWNRCYEPWLVHRDAVKMISNLIISTNINMADISRSTQ
jgi:deoxyribodipyrimidine photolyase